MSTTTNILSLSKCAYMNAPVCRYCIGTREIEHKEAVKKALKTVYNNPEKGANLPYIMENNRAFVELDDVKIDVCDTMLQSVSGEYPNAAVVNGRAFKDLTPFYESFKPGTFTGILEYRDGSQSFWGKKPKSLYFESYPNADSFYCYRLHYRGNSLAFIASNGKLYAAGDNNYIEISTAEVLHRLDAKSKAARDIIVKFLEYIKA